MWYILLLYQKQIFFNKKIMEFLSDRMFISS